MRRLIASLAMLALLLVTIPATVLGASTFVDCRKGADLQAAIDTANSGDTLLLKGTCRGTFTILGKDLTLKGNPRATLDAGDHDAALRINHTGTEWLGVGDNNVVLLNLTITGSGGDTWYADGVHAWGGEVTLRHCRVKGNAGSGLGGDGVTFRLQRSTVRNNAKSGVGAAGDFVNVYLHDSKVSRNGRNGVEAIDLYMYDSTISGNRGNGVTQTVQGYVDARDSRVVNNGGVGINTDGMDLLRVTVRGNHGGGIWAGWDNAMIVVRIDHSTIDNNQAAGDGGGLHCRGGCRVTDSRIVGNTAAGNGGGVHLEHVFGDASASIVRDSVIANNRAGGTGGGIYNASTFAVLLDDVTLRNNRPNDCTGC